MSAVSEWIVREYFEQLGFLVMQPQKYQVAARAKRLEEEIDLVVINPCAQKHEPAPGVIWTSSDLENISRAIVSVRGWHTDRFSPSLLKVAPEIVRFAEEGVSKKAAKWIGEGPAAKILCLPAFASSGSSKKNTLEQLKANGVDGVIVFRTMLVELVNAVDVNKNYEKSDLLQILRILKNYDLLKDAQMELFRKKRKKT